MVESHISPENINGSHAPLPIRFNIVIENGIELLRSGRRIDNLFHIGSLFSLGGKTWVVIDIRNPLSSSDNNWTLVVRPETSDSE